MNKLKKTEYDITSVSLRKIDKNYLLENEIKLSAFIRQAIQSHKEHEWKYRY